MRNSVSTALTFKLIDITAQIASFVFLLTCLPNFLSTPWAFIEAPVQMLSCLLWWIAKPGISAKLGRSAIQKIFFIVTMIGVCCLAGMLVDAEGVFFIYMYAMLIVGPICGLWYFIVTCRETFHLYQRMHRPHMFI